MSRMNAADNLSVQQLHQAVADGTLPAYVGVPMIQDKMKQQQQAMAMQQPQQQPPIADQIMQASAPRRMPRRAPMQPEQQVSSEVEQAPAPEDTQGIEAAQSNLPTQMAQGGILSFADGGMDDQTEDDELEQLYGSGSDNDLIQAIAARGRGSDIHPSAAIQMRPESEGIGFGKGHKYHDAVAKEAERQGLDPAIALHALYRETGGLKDPEKARSKAGAIGVMQLMPATAKSLGVDPTDPYQNIQGGVTYLKQMQDKYQNPQLTLMAYNAGPGRVDKALRSPQGLASLPSETRNYNEGGIAHFANEGLVEAMQASDPMQAPDMTGDNALASNSTILNNLRQELRPQPKALVTPAAKPAPVAAPATDVAPAATPEPAPTPVPAPVPAPPESKPSGIAQLDYNQMLAQNLKDIAAARAEAKKDKETNKYLALMQAGFGMMSGTSPYAAVNIGQGAEKGIGAYASLNQASGKEANDLLAQQNALYKYGSAADAAAERNRIYGQIANTKPTEEDRLVTQYNTALSRNPQILEQRQLMEKEQAAGTLTPERYQQYQDNINKVTTALAKQYKQNPDVTVQLSPVVDPKKVEKPGFFSRINPFTSSTPAPTASGLPSADAVAAEKKRRADAQNQGQ
jgi:hypothetical protein